MQGILERLNDTYFISGKYPIHKTSKTLEELLAVDANAKGVFNFQNALNIDAINKETTSFG